MGILESQEIWSTRFPLLQYQISNVTEFLNPSSIGKLAAYIFLDPPLNLVQGLKFYINFLNKKLLPNNNVKHLNTKYFSQTFKKKNV